MVLDIKNKPYDLSFLKEMEEVQFALSEKYELPYVTEGGRIYENYQELFQLELLQYGVISEEDELLLKVSAGEIRDHAITAVAGRTDTAKGAARKALKGDVAEIGGAVKDKAKDVFSGGLGAKVLGIKAKMTSMATDLKVTAGELSEGFKAGMDSEKPPTSDIYKRSPDAYWKARGDLASSKASADVKYNEAAKNFEQGGSQEDFEKAVSEYGTAISEVDRQAKEIGTSFEMVAAHVDALGSGKTKGVMPPSEDFPDGATKSGEDGSGKKLSAKTSKNLSGSLWNSQVKKRGKDWQRGKTAAESRFKGPGAEGAAAEAAYEEGGGAGQEEKGLREALKNPDEAIKNLPKGSNIDSGDREYLTKPGQEAPEGVRVHFGEPNAQGHRSRF